MHLFLSLFLWILMGAICAYYAQVRGRDPIAWFAIGMLLGLIGLLILFFLPAHEPEMSPEEGMERLEGANPASAMPIAFRTWYVIDKQESQRGPLTFLLLQKLYFEGEIGLQSLVWSEGMESWESLEKQEELKNKVTQ